MWFGGKKNPGKTILVLDVENGSVGSALVRITPAEQPKLFGETRVHTPLLMNRSGECLAKEIGAAARTALHNASEVAARLRMHEQVAPLGDVEHAAIFMSAPWGRPNLAEGRPDFLPSMTDALAAEVARSFGYIPSSLYTRAGAAAFGTHATGEQRPCLVCIVTGEVSELMRMDQSGVASHATIPTGSNDLLRTLKSHGGLSEEEARSAMGLTFDTPHVREPFVAAAAHFAGHFKDAAEELLAPGDVLTVRVVADEPVAKWFARALSQDEALAELFPQGGEVRTLAPSQLSAHIAAHAAMPDTMLLLAALFVDSHFN